MISILIHRANQWPCVLHIVGARTEAHVRDSVSSMNIRLTQYEFDSIDFCAQRSAK